LIFEKWNGECDHLVTYFYLVHCRSYTCTGAGWCPSARGCDDRSWTSENLRFLSQTAQSEGDRNCEGSLGRGNPGDDMGDGGSQEEILSSPIPW